MVLPAGATDRVTFEGIKTTERSVKMLLEARYLFRLRGGGSHPGISQGGYSTSVSASAGTHARDAMDWKTRLMSRTRTLLWEWCVWEVGFAAWRRTAIVNLWPAHTHGVPKNGDLSASAKAQVENFYQGDNGLKSDRDYPRILSSGFARRTWETYLQTRPDGTVDLSGVVAAFESGKPADPAQDAGDNDVQQIQRALNHFLDSKLSIDGVPGAATKGVYATYQSRLYGVAIGHVDANGIPGEDSLVRLGFKVIS